jgi:hypothetical protein
LSKNHQLLCKDILLAVIDLRFMLSSSRTFAFHPASGSASGLASEPMGGVASWLLVSMLWHFLHAMFAALVG